MNHLLRKLRAYLYKLGYRPKFPSILFSPSLDAMYLGKESVDSLIKTLMEDLLYRLLNGPVNKLRTLVYKCGFRPKFGTVLHSPSLHATYLMAGCMDAMIAEMVKTPAVEIDVLPVTRSTLYHTMKYCVVCGAELEDFVADIKECPNGCGRGHPIDNWEGLPTITFELSEKG